MKGDFSRLTFDPEKHFTRVLLQQGRVQLDADWNEQAAILLHSLERLATDLIGPFGGPADALGFAIDFAKDAAGKPANTLTIGAGRYYVDGLLAENLDGTASYALDPQKEKPPLLAYLDVWERHVTYIEDGTIREVALEGPDTATRAQRVWQVRVTNQAPVFSSPDGKGIFPNSRDQVETVWPRWVEIWQPANRGRLQAQAKPSGDPTDPCVASPDARFRGLENQLYRVEVHTGGTAGGGATFVWSRDNGSVTFPVTDLATDGEANATTVSLDNLGHEGRSALAADDWVEVADDDVSFGRRAGVLLQVAAVDADRRQVTLRGIPNPVIGQDESKHPLLRRWDYGRTKDAKPAADGALPIVEGSWIDLEDGVQVFFQAAVNSPAHRYRTGDYWLIPARTVTGDIEWPQELDTSTLPPKLVPKALPPFGVRHHFAPLFLIPGTNDSLGHPILTDLRRSFKRLAV